MCAPSRALLLIPNLILSSFGKLFFPWSAERAFRETSDGVRSPVFPYVSFLPLIFFLPSPRKGPPHMTSTQCWLGFLDFLPPPRCLQNLHCFVCEIGVFIDTFLPFLFGRHRRNPRGGPGLTFFPPTLPRYRPFRGIIKNLLY